MNEVFQEAINAAERVVAGEENPGQDFFEQLLSRSGQLESIGDEERAYLAVLLDAISLRHESARVLRDASGPGLVGVNATLRNLEGVLAAVHGQYGQAQDILKGALSAARDPSLRSKILANLAAVSLRAGSMEEALAWATAGASGDAGDPAADMLIASVQAAMASDRRDTAGLRIAALSLADASRSRIAELGTQHPQALTVVANMANIEIMLARAEGSQAGLERAVTVLEVAACRLAAELGADHPQSLAAIASLAWAELDLARTDGSTKKIEQAITTAATVSQRIDSVIGDTHPEALILAESLAAARREFSLAQGSVPSPEKGEAQTRPERAHPSAAPGQDNLDAAQGQRHLRHVLLYPIRLVLFLVSLSLATPVVTFITTIGYAAVTPYCYVAALFRVLAPRPDTLPPPRWSPRRREDGEPAELGYFYGPVFTDLIQVAADASWLVRRQGNRGADIVQSEIRAWRNKQFQLSRMPLFAAGIGVAFGMALGIALGAIGFVAIAIVHAVVVAAVFGVMRITGGLLWVLDTGLLRIKNTRTICPFCYERVLDPAYECPGCARWHRDLRPGRYGTLQRRCLCGAEIPTLQLLGSAWLEAYCPRCGFFLPHRPGEAQEIVLPFFGAPGAGKTRLMYGIVTLLRSTADLNTEFADSATSHDLADVEQLLASGIAPIKTSTTMPRGQVLRITSGRRTRVLQLFDTSGERFYTSDSVRDLSYLTEARTFVLVIDPLSIDHFWSGLPNKHQVELSAARSHAPSPERACLQACEQMEAMGVPLRKARLAVVFSRADLLQLPDGEPVRNWATDALGLGNLIRSVEYQFGEIRFFRTASVLENDDKLHPSIVELTRWLLARDGIKLPGPPSGRSS